MPYVLDVFVLDALCLGCLCLGCLCLGCLSSWMLAVVGLVATAMRVVYCSPLVLGSHAPLAPNARSERRAIGTDARTATKRRLWPVRSSALLGWLRRFAAVQPEGTTQRVRVASAPALGAALRTQCEAHSRVACVRFTIVLVPLTRTRTRVETSWRADWPETVPQFSLMTF